MKPYSFILLATALAFASCNKISVNDLLDNGSPSCTALRSTRLTTSKTTYNAGEDITLALQPALPDNTYAAWYSSNSQGQLSGSSSLTISDCGKADKGWYYATISNSGCTTIQDSVYITVVNAADTAPCSIANNNVYFSGLPDISFSSTSYSEDPTWGSMILYADYAYGYPDISIYFNQYWNTHVPEDGKYSLAYIGDLGDASNVYTLTVQSLYEGIEFSAETGDVYVSHVNGKMVVKFCSLGMVGSDGSNTFRTTAEGQLTAP